MNCTIMCSSMQNKKHPRCSPQHLHALPRLILLTWHLPLLPEDKISFKGILLLPFSLPPGVKTKRPLLRTIPSSSLTCLLPREASLPLLLGFWDTTSQDI